MRLLLIILLISFHSNAQTYNSTVGIQFGYDYYNPFVSGWNIGLNGGHLLKEDSRWTIEGGFQYSESEFNNPDKTALSADSFSVDTFSPVAYPTRVMYYRKYNFFRPYVGINYRIWKRNRYALHCGIDFCSSITVGERGHGEYLEIAIDSSGNLTAGEVKQYSHHRSINNSTWYYFLETVPYVEYRYDLGQRLSLSSRISYFLPILEFAPWDVHAQLDVGVSYRF